MTQNRRHSDEHKEANKKVVTIGGKKKLLLFDNEETEQEEPLTENELIEMIRAMVAEAASDLNGQINLNEAWLDEADYPEGFSIKQFKALPSFRKRVEYAKQHLDKAGRGSSRIVFAVDPDTVVKIALNKKGQAQNEVEIDVSNIGYENIAEVKNFDEENYLYIEMEKAQKMKKSDWKRITGQSFYDWMSVLHNYMLDHIGKRGLRKLVPENFEDIEESELFNNVVTMMVDFEMPVGDISRVSSWGIIDKDGQEVPVLIDYGLTKTVYSTHYR